MSLSYRHLPLAALTAALLASGCGTDSSPVATHDSDDAAAATAVLSLTPDNAPDGAPAAAGKTLAVPAEGLSDAARFFPRRRGRLHVEDLGRRGVRDDLEVDFLVQRGDLSSPEYISMTVYGNTLSELTAAFQPAGLVFANPAQLRVTIGAARVDQDLLDLKGLLLPFAGMEADHTHGDGDTESARITSVRTFIRLPLLGDVETHDLLLYDYAVITVEVPGFSRYGLRR